MENLNNLRNELLFQLFKDAEIPFNNNLTDEQKQNFLYALIVMRHAEQPDEKLLNLQNKYLTEINKKLQNDIKNIKFKNNFYFTTENILNFNADLLLLISDNLFEDVAALTDNTFCPDNDLLFRAGMEYKYNVVKNLPGKIDYNAPIIEGGYNLPVKNIAKIIYNKNLIDEIKNANLNKKIKKDINFINFFNNLTNNFNVLFNFIKNNSIKSAAIYVKENPLKNEIINLIKNYNKKAKIKIIIN